MIERFADHVNNRHRYLKNSKLLIAISGGLDSVVLTSLCKKLEFNISLAHCNFKLRGSESEADEQFIINLAESCDLEVFVESFDTERYAKEKKLSVQMAARELRYEWFNDLSKQMKFDYILTAHHADDNLETFLINLSRGTGLDGLTGIPELKGNVVRPLLPFGRSDLENFARRNKITWREDSSNKSNKYLRNSLRHQIVPRLKEINPQILENFQKTISHLKDANHIIAEQIERIKKKVIFIDENGNVQLKISKIKKLSNPKIYLYYLLKDYGFTEWNDVNDLLDSQSGKQIVSSTHRLIKDRKTLILSNINCTHKMDFKIKESDRELKYPDGVLRFDEANSISNKHSNIAFLDKDLLKFPMTLRRWRKGDYFYPFGMQGRKKLSKFFKDEKFSIIDKENVWLLCSDDTVVWIISHRMDDRFKVTEETKNIIKVSHIR